ncbi:CoA-binding protein [Hippea alviniae]|uniref:CoA-binding protein n=1 Tax=Hippea alviniae TaxID=1279027 RepID=UPI0003B49137|nr:CoA-binding protein [Hippea alviniae]
MEKPAVDACRVGLGNPSEEEEKKMIEALRYKNIAVVGLSPKPSRASYDVAKYLKDNGYTIIPVRPATKEILGEKCYKTLLDVDRPVDVVDVFRRSEYAPELAKQAVEIGAKVLWLQEGIVSEEAKRIAEESGLIVIMDYCMKKAYKAYKDKL